MHHFERGESPVDMSSIKAHYINWDAFGKTHEHRLLGDALYERQHHFCAYCEKYLQQIDDGFIEHLVRRKDVPQRTFDWTNMFFSCKHEDSCGLFKDNSKNGIVFNENDIIDPSSEHSQDYFCFDQEGHIFPRPDLSPREKQRAEETIRIFNLNNSERLCRLREKAVRVVEYFLTSGVSMDSVSIDRFLAMLENADCLSVYYTLLDRRMP